MTMSYPSKLKPTQDFARFVIRHEENILCYFKLPIDDGSVERINTEFDG